MIFLLPFYSPAKFSRQIVDRKIPKERKKERKKPPKKRQHAIHYQKCIEICICIPKLAPQRTERASKRARWRRRRRSRLVHLLFQSFLVWPKVEEPFTEFLAHKYAHDRKDDLEKHSRVYNVEPFAERAQEVDGSQLSVKSIENNNNNNNNTLQRYIYICLWIAAQAHHTDLPKGDDASTTDTTMSTWLRQIRHWLNIPAILIGMAFCIESMINLTVSRLKFFLDIPSALLIATMPFRCTSSFSNRLSMITHTCLAVCKMGVGGLNSIMKTRVCTRQHLSYFFKKIPRRYIYKKSV